MIRQLLFAIAALPLVAFAQERALPEDVLLGGRIDDVFDTKQLTENTFEWTLKIKVEGATALHIAMFCLAGSLAHMRGYASWTLGTPPESADPAVKPVFTIVLLRDASEVASLPTTRTWLPFADMKGMRSMCTKFINPKYMWPAD